MDTDLTTQNQFKSNSLRAKWAVILLSVAVIVGAIAVASDLAELSLLSRASQGESISMGEANANDGRQQLIGVLQLTLIILTAIIFLLWTHRANENLSALGAKDLRFTPGWAVGNFFIPILNFFRPAQVMAEIWKASDPRDESGVEWKTATSLPIISWWWIAYIGSGIIASWAGRIDFSTATLQQIMTSSRLVALSDLASVVAGILAILIVRDINERQEEKAKLQLPAAQLF